MTWQSFPPIAIFSIICWLAAIIGAYMKQKTISIGLTLTGILTLTIFIAGIWISMERPPLRTVGETRLWYSLFLAIIGLIIYTRQRYKSMLTFCLFMAIIFLIINIFKPEIHDKHLMPALQSPWFVPHVIVYMVAYALMGAAFIWSIHIWWHDKFSRRLSSNKEPSSSSLREYNQLEDAKNCDILLIISWSFLTMGMAMGALWAKEAWGDWWTWDPKETWAAATWLSCLLYIHVRQHDKSSQTACLLLILCFTLLQICWWGVNYLPSAQGASMHTY